MFIYNDLSTEKIARCLYIINRNAKAATQKTELYSLKNETVKKLLSEGKAKKVGLHFSPTARNCQQRTDVLIQVEQYFFHVPPSKEDFNELPHLGKREESFRNPKTFVPLKEAKETLKSYVGIEEEKNENTRNKQPQKPLQKKSYFHNQQQPNYRTKNTYVSYFS